MTKLIQTDSVFKLPPLLDENKMWNAVRQFLYLDFGMKLSVFTTWPIFQLSHFIFRLLSMNKKDYWDIFTVTFFKGQTSLIR